MENTSNPGTGSAPVAPRGWQRLPPWARKSLRVIIASAIGAIAVLIGLLYFGQRSMIYYPGRYDNSYARGLPPGTVEVFYKTSQGLQTAFYVPPTQGAGEPPGRLLVMFMGNASLALDWLDMVERLRDARTGFLLVDYPGYGKCEGNPSRDAIVESSEAAFLNLSAQLHSTPEAIEKNLEVVGLSIGAAAGLEFASRHPVRRIVLLGAFTDMLEMARLSVGWPLCHLLEDRFDNRARLGELAARPDPPRVHLFHGTVDTLVPFRMGEELATAFPQIVTLHRVEGSDHNMILMAAEPEVVKLLSVDQPPASTGISRPSAPRHDGSN
jgi:uncharacterized protein